jgi:hypothetical protein
VARSAEEARVRVWPRLAALDGSKAMAWRFELNIYPDYSKGAIDTEEVL